MCLRLRIIIRLLAFIILMIMCIIRRLRFCSYAYSSY